MYVRDDVRGQGVGKALVKQSADALLRTSMELGGNAPFVVFDDADVDAAVDGAMLAKMRNGGEACTAANRILYQQHHTHWIESGCPGVGNILIFNNGIGRGYSTVNEIVPPVNRT